jgi:hypothetical protein
MKNLDLVKKTVAKRMRLSIRYGSINYVAKNLLEAKLEYARLVGAITDCQRLIVRGPQNQHPNMHMARFVLSQFSSDPDSITSAKELAGELGRLNGILEETRLCVAPLSDSCPHVKAVKFFLTFKQTARPRDESSGWNRSAIEADSDELNRVTADAEVEFAG